MISFSNTKCASSSPVFTNFRRKWQVFKKGVRLNFTYFRRQVFIFKTGVRLKFTKFDKCSQIFVENGQFSNMMCALISPVFTNFPFFSFFARIVFGNQKTRKWRWKKKVSMIQQEHAEIYRNKNYVRVPHLVGYGDDSGWAKYWSASCAAGCATS